MSVILITNHDESIYNVISESADQHLTKRSVGYRSKFRGRSNESPFCKKSNAKTHATMGLPKEKLPDPAEFLKKRTGKLTHPACELRKQEKHVCFKKDKLVPTKEEVLAYDQKHSEQLEAQKNFIAKNINTVLKMKPKEPDQKVVISPRGTSKFLTEGLEPIFIKSSIFGKTPKYLQRFIAQRARIYQMKKDKSGTEQPKCKYITRDEREKLLNGLKHNWEELQTQYQGLPILTDTIPKKMRKSNLEAELKQLEKDIVLIERHPYIYVYNDQITE